MCTRLLFTLLTVMLAVSLSAGDKPDFSGEWTFNVEKSKLDDMGTQFVPTKLTITQAGNDLTVIKSVQTPEGDMDMEEKLTLDGKECKSEMWNSPRVSTCTWSEDGAVLTIATAITFDMNGQVSQMDMKEAWSLVEEGKVLSVKHSSASDWGERNITMAFVKVDKPAEQ